MTYNKIIPIVFVLTLFSCGNVPKSAKSKEYEESYQYTQDLPQVTVMQVERGIFMRELQSNGKLVAANKVDLIFRSAEIITSISVKNGQRVLAGQEIARIDEFELQNRVITANETFENALKTLEDFLIGFRYELKDTASVPATILQTGYSKSQLLTAQVNLEQAKRNLQNAVLKAPFSGIVANINAKQHNMASISEPFCTIIGDNLFEVDFPVLESEIELLKAAQEIVIEPLAYQGTKIKGTISGMNPIVDKNGMVQAKAIVENKQGNLYEGMNVRVLVQQAIPNKLTVPKSAIVMRSDRQVLFVHKNGRTQWRYVKIGLENSREFTIEEQLEEGEDVIISGNFNLAHDVEVEIINN
ncbi:MAG: efflux RND transporter periplasmic adaptor subunit [Marinilabiliaceae bacterium]|nr:efflux RND transporter periplasmic adaptor subunit [Marinilabiliaceae bacterium]